MQDDTFPPVIFFLLLSNALIFAAGQFIPQFGLIAQLKFSLFSVPSLFEIWQPVTYAFLHANPTHLAFNMFALWMFGRTMEVVWGSRRFLIYYLVCVLGAAAAQLTLAAITGDPSRTVGASGGVYGVLLAFGMTFPNRRILLLFPPIPMPARYLVVMFGIVELYLGFTASNSNVAHFAHLGGMVFGFFLIRLWRSQRRIR
ncbi:MAG: rhomboid family intramembrane serine protease [Pseudomonadota bacterium]